MRSLSGRILYIGFCVLTIWGCGENKVKRLDGEFRAAMKAGNTVEAYAVLGQIQARGLAGDSTLTPREKAECYLAYAEALLAEDYERALQTAELARQALEKVEQSGEPVPASLDQRFATLYKALVAGAPGNIPRPELRRVTFSEDFPEELVADRTRPLDTQILELLMTEAVARLEDRNRELDAQNRELRDRMEDITGPITDIDERLDRVSDRLKDLDSAERDVGELESNVTKIAEDSRLVRGELERVVQDLEKLQEAHGGTAAEVEQILSRLSQVLTRADGIEGRIDEVNVRLARFEQNVIVSNLFRDGVTAYDRGEEGLAQQRLHAYLERAAEDDPKFAEATAILGIIYANRVRGVIAQEEWKTSKRDIEAARQLLVQARTMLAASEKRLDEISRVRLRESVKRELSRMDDYERQLSRP